MSKATKKQTQDTGKDNLFTSLEEFNEGTSSKPEEEVGSQSADSENSMKEGAKKPAKAESKTESSPDDAEWLIENKFRNDDDGRAKLADSYRNVQSMKDKAEGELTKKNERYEKLKELDEWLESNPEMVKKLQQEVKQQQAVSDGPPPKPEDYDIYDESVEGSLSAQWRQKHDEYLMEQGAKKAMGYVDKLREEDKQMQEADAEVQALKKLGMEEDEIKQFYGFMRNPDNVTPENMVEVWKRLDPQAGSIDNNAQSEPNEEDAVRKEMTKVTNAGAVDGKTAPAATPKDKQAEEWWTGIMSNSR